MLASLCARRLLPRETAEVEVAHLLLVLSEMLCPALEVISLYPQRISECFLIVEYIYSTAAGAFWGTFLTFSSSSIQIVKNQTKLAYLESEAERNGKQQLSSSCSSSSSFQSSSPPPCPLPWTYAHIQPLEEQ